jgi:hypothetical protein
MERASYAMESAKGLSHSRQYYDLSMVSKGVQEFDSMGECIKTKDVTHLGLPHEAFPLTVRPQMESRFANVHVDNVPKVKELPLALGSHISTSGTCWFGSTKQSTLTQLIERAITERLKDSPPEAKPIAPNPALVPRPLWLVRHCQDSPSATWCQEQQDSEIPTSKDSPMAINRKMLLVHKLPRCANEIDVRKVFEPFGSINFLSVIRDPSGTSKCYGFVHFSNVQAAQQAVLECEVGRVMLKDEAGKTWHVKAECAIAKVTKDGPERRAKRGGSKHGDEKNYGKNGDKSSSSGRSSR